jgi:hypothetical protein
MTDQHHSIDDSLTWFAESLRASANVLDLNASEEPDLAGATFRGGEASASTKLNPSDLPSVKQGMRIGRYAVVLGILPDAPSIEAVRETLRRYRNQCVVARSYLTANEALDLQLMLVGPRGSEREAEWRALALMVERDDRVARKLAWLRPVDANNDGESFADFLKRTFLARPWKQEGKFSVAPLDRLSAAEDTGDSGVPRNTADEWEATAFKLEEDPSKIVDALVDAWKRRDAV